MSPSSPDLRRPLCFVAMPFGDKRMPDGSEFDFDAFYTEVIEAAIVAAGMDPLRADEEKTGGVIHKQMFERLLLSDYVIADLTTASANVFYELGIRHAVRPYSTVLIAASDIRIPFDVAPARTVMYDHDGSSSEAAQRARDQITTALTAAKDGDVDSPVFQLVEGFGAPSIDRLRTDTFRSRVAYSERIKDKLELARAAGSSLSFMRSE